MNMLANQELVKLAATIRAEHTCVGRALGETLKHALAAGDALIAARRLVPQGEWGAFLRNFTTVGERCARNYMRLANAREVIERQSSAGGPLSIDAALKILREPRPRRASRGASRSKPQPQASRPQSGFSPLAQRGGSVLERRLRRKGSGEELCVYSITLMRARLSTRTALPMPAFLKRPVPA